MPWSCFPSQAGIFSGRSCLPLQWDLGGPAWCNQAQSVSASITKPVLSTWLTEPYATYNTRGKIFFRVWWQEKCVFAYSLKSLFRHAASHNQLCLALGSGGWEHAMVLDWWAFWLCYLKILIYHFASRIFNSFFKARSGHVIFWRVLLHLLRGWITRPRKSGGFGTTRLVSQDAVMVSPASSITLWVSHGQKWRVSWDRISWMMHDAENVIGNICWFNV